MTDKEFNEKVAYNKTMFSWVVDIIITIIWFPIIIYIIIRRIRYNKPRTIFHEANTEKNINKKNTSTAPNQETNTHN